MKTKETLADADLIGMVITNTNGPSKRITNVIPSGYYNTLYNYAIQCDYNHNRLDTMTIESLGLKTMPEKIDFETNRYKALKWWNNLSDEVHGHCKLLSIHKAFDLGLKLPGFTGKGRKLDTLTGSEIEQIWLTLSNRLEHVKKINAKLFKIFDKNLALSYLDKFDDTAKKQFVLEACNMLSKNDLEYLRACITEIISEK